jgi:hypothetical protein
MHNAQGRLQQVYNKDSSPLIEERGARISSVASCSTEMHILYAAKVQSPPLDTEVEDLEKTTGVTSRLGTRFSWFYSLPVEVEYVGNRMPMISERNSSCIR